MQATQVTKPAQVNNARGGSVLSFATRLAFRVELAPAVETFPYGKPAGAADRPIQFA